MLDPRDAAANRADKIPALVDLKFWKRKTGNKRRNRQGNGNCDQSYGGSEGADGRRLGRKE